ncbi:MAG: hypothetical protein ACRDJ4_10950 [Actinomycetota bacterium]
MISRHGHHPMTGSRRALIALLPALLLVSLAAPGGAGPADPDPGFGAGGTLTTSFGLGSRDDAFAVAVQPDGKVLAAGTTATAGGADVALARYDTRGILDPGFGGDGKVITNFGGRDVAYDLALQPGGGILVAGDFDAFGVARYLPDGTLDSAFGSGGTATSFANQSTSGARALVVQDDGKIVAGGSALTSPTSSSPVLFALARYLPDGSPDPSFGPDGTVTTGFGSDFAQIDDLALQADGKVVAAGTNINEMAVVRYNPDGTVDDTFAGSGRLRVNFGVGTLGATGIAVLPDGKLVISGSTVDDVVLARLNPDGTEDTSFGRRGAAFLDFACGEDRADDLVVEPNGRIVIAGSAGGAAPGERQFGAARLNPDGSVDTSFGGSGRATVDFSDRADEAHAVAIAADGRILLAGTAGRSGTASRSFALARLEGGPGVAVSQGYWTVASDGGVFAFGNAAFLGSTGGIALAEPVVAMAPGRTPGGYWMVASDGGVFSFGDACFLGSAAGLPLAAPIVGMSPTRTARGYWLIAADGGVFSFGDAEFLGSTGNAPLNAPIAGMAPTPSGKGYWLVAADGGIFAQGDAKFLGSTGGIRLNRPIVGVAPTPSGNGYWLVASDGGIFAFGDAGFLGSTGGISLNAPIVGMASTPSGAGYWLVGSDGGIFAFGDAGFLGSTGGIRLNAPIRGIAAPRL